MSIETTLTNNNISFIGSIDFNTRFFYIRSGKFFQNLVGHESNTNSVLLLLNGNAFGTGSDDSTFMLIDTRFYEEVIKLGYRVIHYKNHSTATPTRNAEDFILSKKFGNI